MSEQIDAEALIDVASVSAPSNDINADDVIPKKSIQPSYPERKDGWITRVALSIIVGSGLLSGVAFIVALFGTYCVDGVCTFPAPPSWAPELLRLALVSSLAFVMGTSNNGS